MYVLYVLRRVKNKVVKGEMQVISIFPFRTMFLKKPIFLGEVKIWIVY